MTSRTPVRHLAGEPVTDLTRTVGCLNLALCAVVNVAVALALAALLVRGEFTPLLVATLPAVVDEVTLVANVPVVLTVAAWGAPVVCVTLLLVGLFQLSGSWHTYHARRWSLSIASAGLGVVNPIVIPPSAVAFTLLYLARGQFTGGPEDRSGPS